MKINISINCFVVNILVYNLNQIPNKFTYFIVNMSLKSLKLVCFHSIFFFSCDLSKKLIFFCPVEF